MPPLPSRPLTPLMYAIVLPSGEIAGCSWSPFSAMTGVTILSATPMRKMSKPRPRPT